MIIIIIIVVIIDLLREILKVNAQHVNLIFYGTLSILSQQTSTLKCLIGPFNTGPKWH